MSTSQPRNAALELKVTLTTLSDKEIIVGICYCLRIIEKNRFKIICLEKNFIDFFSNTTEKVY